MRNNGRFRSMMAAPLFVFILAATGAAQAEQGIPAMPARSVIAQTMASGGGEQYPGFGSAETTVMSERVAMDRGGEHYPVFANPTDGGTAADYAALGSVTGMRVAMR